jgi:hypothetical protein
MSVSWVKVTPNEANQHELYGIGGWLIVFAVGLGTSFLWSLVSIRLESLKLGMSFFELLSIPSSEIFLLKTTLLIDLFSIVIIYWNLFSISVNFRTVTTFVLLATTPLEVIILFLFSNQLSDIASDIGKAIVMWIFTCSIWVSYLHASRRVRVTFEHCVRSDDCPIEQHTIDTK